MNIAIRVDAGYDIGAGHVIRCVSLADELTKRGHTVTFISTECPGHYCDFIEKKGYEIHRLTSTPYGSSLTVEEKNKIDAKLTIECLRGKTIDWLVVDSYLLGVKWEQELRHVVKRIMVIDDFVNRPHDCDILVDQDSLEVSQDRYVRLVGKDTLLLVGVKYVTLRPQFAQARQTLRKRSGDVNKLLVGFGGSDNTNCTLKTVETIRRFHQRITTTHVMVGQANRNKDSILKFCMREPSFVLHDQIENVANVMVHSDLGIGAGGTMTWERCCLGLPSLVITIDESQRALNQTLDKMGVVVHLGDDDSVTHEAMFGALQSILDDKQRLIEMSRRGMELIDGRGIIRIIDAWETYQKYGS